MHTTFLPLSGLYEPSAVQQLADGRFLVVEDEKQQPFKLLSIMPDGSTRSEVLDTEAAGDATKLEDLEGLTADKGGHIYATTSHSRTESGKEKRSRERLVRFRIEDNRMVGLVLCQDLKQALVNAHPLLAQAAAVEDVKSGAGLNIEAIEAGQDQDCLLVGLRSPLIDGKAVIAVVENLGEVFGEGVQPRLRPELTTLDLDGQGIRALSFVPALGGYLVVAGPAGRGKRAFKLWFWGAKDGERPRNATLSDVPGMERAEGVCPATLDGAEKLLIVSDDGDRESGQVAQYLLVDTSKVRVQA